MKDPIFQLCDRIRETAFSLHRHLRPGHMEKVYEHGLSHRLRKQGLAVSQPYPISVFAEDGTTLGTFAADLFVTDRLIVELKACRALADERVAQLLGFLRASRIEHGLPINFGSPVLEIRKFALRDAS